MGVELDAYVQRQGALARRAQANTSEPWTAEQEWQEFSKAVLKRPTAELRALFMKGWDEA